MRPSRPLLLVLGVAVLLSLPAGACAEPAFSESIEWITVDADLVVAGKVVKVEGVCGYEAATVAVSKTLKGKHTASVTFLLCNYNGSVAAEWKADGVPILFFLVERSRSEEFAKLPVRVRWVLRDDQNNHSAVLLGKPKRYWTMTIRAYTRDFDILEDPAAILKRVADAAASCPQRVRPHRVMVPGRAPLYKKERVGGWMFMVVPVDEELQTLGRRWCRSRSAFDRMEGVKILAHFKNDENVRILKALLQDPHTSEKTLHRTVPGQQELALVYRKKVYPVRQHAFEALQGFEMKVEKPVLEELLEGKDP